MPRFAAIDVGSNAIRLRIVEAQAPSPFRGPESQLSLLPLADDSQLDLLASATSPASGADGSGASGGSGSSPPPPTLAREFPSGWREVQNVRAAVRLGGEVFVSGRLTPASIALACEALRSFRTAMDAEKVDAYRATATSAVREASNAPTLVERARREAGIELEVIEGVEEARLIQLAVVRRLGLVDRRALLVDVGGGSTELTVLEGGRNAFSISLPLGTVRILETFLKGMKTLDPERERLLTEGIERALGEIAPPFARRHFDVLIGTGGNIDTLADLCPLRGGHQGHPRAIEVAALGAFQKRIARMTKDERRDAYGLRPDRADTIVPATAIFRLVAERFRMGAIVAPGVGLKEGILEELVDKHFRVWDVAGEAESVLAACVRLGRRYQFDEAHGVLVADLAGRIFDDLQPIHAFRDRDRLLLRAAAILHDIGDFVRYDGHHKHSYYLIQHSDIMGLTPDERAIVANIARYHRKSVPDPSHPNFRELDRDARGKVRGLSAILRIADALDREHRGKVTAVKAVLERAKRKVTLFLEGDQERELEEWTVRAKAELLRDVYDLEVSIAPTAAADAP